MQPILIHGGEDGQSRARQNLKGAANARPEIAAKY
jgi:hypothetical protein